MFQTFKNAWKTPDLRKKLLFTAMILLLYRIGACLFVPYVDVNAISTNLQWFGSESIFTFVGLLSGEAFSKATLFALSVSPYITASIVMQLLTIALPPLERLSKQGEEGKKKITAYTRWVTVALALITAYGYVKLLESYSLLTVSSGDKMYVFAQIVMVACFCAGAALIMWLAEQINDHGIGNGISMILFANILSSFSSMISSMITMVTEKEGGMIAVGILEVILSLALTLGAIVLIVWFTNSERRIPIQYAKRVVGRKMYGGQSSNLPLKMNMAGVMPVIFASSIVSIPATIAGFMTKTNWFTKFVENWFSYTDPLYIALFVVLIFLFSYFYIMISFNPVEVANNIRNNGGAIPGIRPGKPTSDYIKKILNRITLLGAVFLVVIAAVPMIITAITSAFNINFASFAFTGTSLLIVVGVALETVRDLEAQLAMRNYKGFLD
ncbi:MAG: preprotein translocase subunit SecY [Clostridia bacterium]|nr:preprotein translocase subunit SecY [Clostridia bacterium]